MRSTGELTIGTGISQLVPILVTPILTRLFTPESFGQYALFLSLLSILVIPATGKLELALPIPKSNMETQVLVNYTLFWLVLFCLFIFSIEIAIVVFWNLNLVLFLLPLALFLQGVFFILNYWYVRSSKFKLLSYGYIVKSISIAIFTLIISIFYRNEFGLILGHLLGLFLTVLFLFNKLPFRIFVFNFDFLRRFKHILIEQIDFPKKSVINGLLNILSSQSPVIILSSLFPSNIVGYYFQAQRMLYAPITLIGTSISKVLYKKINERKQQNRSYYLIILKIIKTLFILILIPALIILFWGPWLFKFLLGAEWELTGTYASLIMPWMFMLFIVFPLTIIFEAEKKQFILAKFNSVLLFFRVLSLYLGFLLFANAFFSVAFFSGVSFIVYSIILYWIIKFTKRQYVTF